MYSEMIFNRLFNNLWTTQPWNLSAWCHLKYFAMYQILTIIIDVNWEINIQPRNVFTIT